MEQDVTIGQMVANDYRRAEVFKKYGIDYCCGGKKTLSKVCAEKGIPVEQLLSDLKSADSPQSFPSPDFASWDAGFLADYIVNTHHKYVILSIPLIFEATQKVSKVHGQQYPEVIQAAGLFMEVMNELNHHMMKEENILFPYIKQLSEAKKFNRRISPSPFGTIRNPVNMMEREHDAVGNLMKEIRKITGDYNIPPGACNSFRYSYLKLNEFENDLHRHIHLENNILFPKAIELEIELTS